MEVENELDLWFHAIVHEIPTKVKYLIVFSERKTFTFRHRQQYLEVFLRSKKNVNDETVNFYRLIITSSVLSKSILRRK